MYPYNSRYASLIQHNPTTNEPFIELPAPLSNIRLTPPRLEDIDATLPIMNDPRVYLNFSGPPYPYLREHSDEWIRARVLDYEEVMKSISQVEGEVGFLEAFPLRHIREFGSDGTETFLGDIGLSREDVFREIKDPEARAARVTANINLPTGDSEIVWTIGDYLRPSHHKRGIMSAVLKLLVESWAIPHMNARKFQASTFTQNVASQKVFLKNGFKFSGRVDGAVQFPENKGGKLMDIFIYERDDTVPETTNAGYEMFK